MKIINIRNLLISVYVLVILTFSAISKADVRIQPWTPAQQNEQKFVGFVTESADGHFYLVIDEENGIGFELQGDVDFSQFNGWTVKVLGIEKFMYKVGPVLSLSSYDPLNDDQGTTVAVPILFVKSINGISLRE